MVEVAYSGLLVIGDPHLEGRQPGFRKDDYPAVILDKVAWCLDYATRHRLLPALLGDVFDKPRDNPNWLVVRLLKLLRGEVLALFGNHDVHYNAELTDDDSLSLLVKSDRIRLVSEENPWRGTMGGRSVVIGGSSYRQVIPERFDRTGPDMFAEPPLSIWLTHHDVIVPGYDDGRFHPREIEGIDVVINGHVHRRLEDVRAGKTLWLTPGNISRRARRDATREHTPAVLRLDVTPDAYTLLHVPVPHRPHDEVFHEAVIEEAPVGGGSAFVAGLAEMLARPTASGAGLMNFLQSNIGQFEPEVAKEIMNLAREVAADGEN